MEPEVKQLVECLTAEGVAFRGPLDLYEPPASCAHDIHIHLCRDILPVVEVQHRPSAHQTNADGRYDIAQGKCVESPELAERSKSQTKRYTSSGNRGGSRPAVRLEYVTVDNHRPRAKCAQVANRPE